MSRDLGLDLGLATIPVMIDHMLRTPAAWSANGYLFDDAIGRTRFWIEPGYFALAAAWNVAAAYRPDGVP